MFPLASIAFIITGVLFVIYSLTFDSLVGYAIQKARKFAYAFFCLALAFLIWGIAAVSADSSILAISVLVGDVLIFIGSIFLLDIQLSHIKNGKTIAVTSGLAFSIFFVWLRLAYYPPKPTLENGILLFNTQPLIALMISLIIVCIWLPANITVAHMIAKKLNTNSLSFLYSSMYVMATVAALLFLSAKTMVGVIVSFAGIAVCFAMLLTSNIITGTLLKEQKK